MCHTRYRRFVILIALIVVLVTIVFWRGTRGSGAVLSSGTSFQGLVGRNGLFADPAALQANDQPSLYATAYDSLAVTELAPLTSASKATLSAFDLRVIDSRIKGWGSLFGGLYLTMEEREFRNLPMPNVASVRATLNPAGYFLQTPRSKAPLETAANSNSVLRLGHPKS